MPACPWIARLHISIFKTLVDPLNSWQTWQLKFPIPTRLANAGAVPLVFHNPASRYCISQCRARKNALGGGVFTSILLSSSAPIGMVVGSPVQAFLSCSFFRISHALPLCTFLLIPQPFTPKGYHIPPTIPSRCVLRGTTAKKMSELNMMFLRCQSN